MQPKTLLAFICVIAAVLIEQSNSAPAPAKPTTTIATTTAVPAKPINVKPGARTAWTTKIDAKSKKLFKSHAKIISKKLHDVHKVDRKFKLKPSKTASQVVSGLLQHYLIELPTKKYAHVTILSQAWKKAAKPNEKHVTVRPELYELNDPSVA